MLWSSGINYPEKKRSNVSIYAISLCPRDGVWECAVGNKIRYRQKSLGRNSHTLSNGSGKLHGDEDRKMAENCMGTRKNRNQIDRRTRRDGESERERF